MQTQQKKKKGLSDNTKLLVILAAVLVVMGVVFLVVTLTGGNASKNTTSDIGGGSTAEETGPATQEFDINTSTKIVNRSSFDVASVEVTTDTGENFTIKYSKAAVGKFSEMSGGDPLLAYSVDEMNMLSGYVALLVALEEVGEGDDADFGFLNPQRRLKVTFTDGEVITLLIGKDTPYVVGTDRGVYIRREDSNIIYTVGGSTAEVLMKTRADYREAMIFDVPASFDGFTEVTVSRSGQPDLKVQKKSADEKEVAEDASLEAYIPDYKIVSPVQRNADNFSVEEKLFNKLLKLKSATIVEDYPKDLSVYGLDRPIKLKFKTSSGEECSLLLGNRTKNGNRYVMEEGIPSVGETNVDIDLSTISHADIAEKLLWFFNSTDSPVFEYELPGGEKHTLEVWSENKSVKTKYDGGEIPRNDGKNLFFYTVGLALEGACPSDATLGESAIKIKVTLSTGKTSTLELLRLNERQYAVRIDGAKPQFYVGVDAVTSLLDCFEIIKNGGTIPDAL